MAVNAWVRTDDEVTTLLGVDGLTVRHGGLVAVDDVTLRVGEGEIAGLIGPNGAGKTTFIDTVTGFTAQHSGRITFGGHPIELAPAHQRARRGLARTFQSLELFDDLRVRENLTVAATTPTIWATITDALWPKRQRGDHIDEILDWLGLTQMADRLPPHLSNGQRHLVALGRALAANPRLVLLDEPAAGLDPRETEELSSTIRKLPERGTTVLLVDHDMSLVLGVCDMVHVLDFGRLIASGRPAQIRSDPTVVAAYLGSSSPAPAERPQPTTSDPSGTTR